MKRQKVWVYTGRKNLPKIPDVLKAEVTARANDLIDKYLKPTYVEIPPENPQFNYIMDIYSKWFHSSFYFCAKYCVPGPNALVLDFESRFARMRYTGNQKFDLSFMRHTGDWVEFYDNRTLDECLNIIKADPYLHP